MFEYKIYMPHCTVTLSPKEINDILTMNTGREALIGHLMGSLTRSTDELKLLCRHLYGMTPNGVIDNNKLIRRVITMAGNGTHPQSDAWNAAAHKVLADKAACTYNNNLNRMTLMAITCSGKKLEDKRAKLNGLLNKFVPNDVDIQVISYNISPKLVLVGFVNKPFGDILTKDEDWVDTRENWMEEMLSEDSEKPLVLHMHGGEIYVMREHADKSAS